MSKTESAQQVKTLDKISNLCKRRGFIFQSSEIYGGLNGVWDFGPLGADLKNNIRDHWWKTNTQLRDDVVGMDGSILMNRKIWQASGHEATFSDPLVDCKKCKGRFRADQLEEQKCPTCGGELTEPRQFNLMLKTYLGPIEDASGLTYLRPETAQAIFAQFKNVLETSRKKLPFGIAQVGKAFRNEINPRNFIFRVREFEQMEIEFFVRPEDGFKWTDIWLEERLKWYEQIGIPRSKITINDIPDGDRAFYSKKTYDLEYEYPFGVQELEGIAYRTDYDLGKHQEHSGKNLEYFDEETKEKFIPHVVEPSAGLTRTVLAILCEAYDEEVETDDKGKEEIRTILRFKPAIAPIKVGIFPLLKNKPELVDRAKAVTAELRRHMKVMYDDSGAIGRRYRRQDEIGTPFCVTIDFETFEGTKEAQGDIAQGEKDTVTLRHRDSMKQERIRIKDLLGTILPQVTI
jgi:glycyl-tRNA synthetase